MNFLVTGASGYLGSCWVDRLSQNPESKVFAHVRQTSSLDRLTPLIKDRRNIQLHYSGTAAVDVVLHCAALYGSNAEPESALFRTNYDFGLETLGMAQAMGAKLFLNFDTALPSETSLYSKTKKKFSNQMRSHTHSLVFVNAATELFYGPGEPENRLLSRWIHHLLESVPELKLTWGEQKRDFIYIEDLMDAAQLLIQSAINHPRGFYEYGLGSGKPILMRECVSRLQDWVGNRSTHLHFGAIPYREHELMESHCDLTQLKLLGWKPKIDFETGVKRLIEACRSKHQNILS